MKQIFEEGLNIQKTRLRELRTQATGKCNFCVTRWRLPHLEMRQAEADRRENELASIENFYKDKFDMLAESLKGQQGLVRKQEKENRRERLTAKNELTKRLEQELQDMQVRFDLRLLTFNWTLFRTVSSVKTNQCFIETWSSRGCSRRFEWPSSKRNWQKNCKWSLYWLHYILNLFFHSSNILHNKYFFNFQKNNHFNHDFP